MKCKNCGAEIGNSNVCEFCGTQITYDMRKEQEQINKQGCPKCGSSNIQFRRENQGEIYDKGSRRIVNRTVGFCNDCGHTWYPSGDNDVPKKNNMIWWVLGWIFFFPAPLMVLIWRKKNTWDIKIKLAVTVVFWLVMIVWAWGSDSSTSNQTSKSEENTQIVTDNSKTNIGPEQTNQNDIAEDSVAYSEDAKVNQFITDYNNVTRYEMTDFEKGNIRTKLYGYTNNCRVELLNPASTSGYSFIVKIYGGNDEEQTDRMYEVFPDFIHALDSSISDEQIEEAISYFKDETTMLQGYNLGDDLVIDYFPLIFRDDGSWLSSSRIEISSLNYGN